jgi:DNA-binding NarL/FixJ family response regulator
VTISVVLADDQALIRHGLRLVLQSEADITVVAEAGDGHEAIAAAEQHRPDLVLMDIRMPHCDGIEATRRICASPVLATTSVLILTTYDTDEYVFAALRSGASGFILKHISPEDLIGAVRTTAAGGGLIAPNLTRKLIAEFAKMQPPPRAVTDHQGLTRRELEVLEAVGRGLTNAEIADRLFLGEATVKTHLSHILTKLNLRDRVHAVIYAYEAGVVTTGSSDFERSS